MVELYPEEHQLKLISPWRIKVVDEVSRIIAARQAAGEKGPFDILEVGCDNAIVSMNIKQRFGDVVRVTGIDVREDEFADGVALAKKHDIDVEFRQALFLDLDPAAEKKYDIVIFSEVYEHLLAENQPKSLRVLGCLLKDEGRLVMTIPNGDYVKAQERRGNDFDSRYPSNFFDNLKQTGHWLEPSRDELRKLARNLGYDVIKCHYFSLPFSGRAGWSLALSSALEGTMSSHLPLARLVWKNVLLVAKKNPNSPLLRSMSL